jgi:ATP-dependent DNA ligase
LRHSHAPARPPGAFDLIEFNGSDLRREPIEIRKTQLAKLIQPLPCLQTEEQQTPFAHCEPKLFA